MGLSQRMGISSSSLSSPSRAEGSQPIPTLAAFFLGGEGSEKASGFQPTPDFFFGEGFLAGSGEGSEKASGFQPTPEFFWGFALAGSGEEEASGFHPTPDFFFLGEVFFGACGEVERRDGVSGLVAAAKHVGGHEVYSPAWRLQRSPELRKRRR